MLRTYDPGGAADVLGQVLDANYQPFCEVRYVDRCALEQPGPYRLFLREQYGTASAYTLRMPRLSQPVGCPACRSPRSVIPGGRRQRDGKPAGGGGLPRVHHPRRRSAADPAQPVPRPVPRLDDLDAAGDQVCAEDDPDRGCPVPAAGSYTLLISP